MVIKCFLIFCAVALCVTDGQQFRVDYRYDQEAGGWLKLHLMPAAWADARLRCHREGAVLASPENFQLQRAIKNVVTKFEKELTHGIYTGISATYAKGYYYSIGGKHLSSIHWAAEEPFNSGNAGDCLYMLLDGAIAKVNCSFAFPYVCYKKQVPGQELTECGTFDRDYVLDNRTGHCYKFHTNPQQWSNAFATCSSEGGHLAIINSETEAQVLHELYKQHPTNSMPGNFEKHIAHVGFRDWTDHGLWMTVHGETLKEAGYDKWALRQPDNFGGDQRCGGIFMTGLLDDLWCLGSYPFICEKEPDSLLQRDIRVQ